MGVHDKLLIIQKKLKAPKSQFNSFGKYNYRNCEDVLEAVKPLLVETNCTLFIDDSVQLVGTRHYIEATVTIMDIETKESIAVRAYAREEESKKGMDGSQVSGASSSYARKYALNGLFLIDDTKDSDSTNNTDKDSHVDNKKDIPKSYVCADCGKPFEAFTSKGKTYTAGQAYHISEGKNPDGKARCKICRENFQMSYQEQW